MSLYISWEARKCAFHLQTPVSKHSQKKALLSHSSMLGQCEVSTSIQTTNIVYLILCVHGGLRPDKFQTVLKEARDSVRDLKRHETSKLIVKLTFQQQKKFLDKRMIQDRDLRHCPFCSHPNVDESIANIGVHQSNLVKEREQHKLGIKIKEHMKEIKRLHLLMIMVSNISVFLHWN